MKVIALVVLSIVLMQAGAAAATPAACPSSAFLTYESGTLVGVDSMTDSVNVIRTRSVMMQSATIDATIHLRPDATSISSSTTLTMAGMTGSTPAVRNFGTGVVYWSDMVPSSLEQVIARARYLGSSAASIPTASLFSGLHGFAAVTQTDPTDWIVSYHNKRYLALTDDHGCLLAASLPEYGVTIERRSQFSTRQYPAWAPYASPPDGAYSAADVRIKSTAGYTLAGTLTRPKGRGPFPGVVLISGISRHERNNGDPPWMPFRDIADALTRSGIAVLRVDDRGVGASTGDNSALTTFGKADDVRTEAAWLASQPAIDAKRIALVGYSEGGLIAQMVAADNPSIAAVVSLAGPGVPALQVARYQITAAVMHDSTIPDASKQAEIAKELAAPLTPHEQSFMSIDPLEYARRVRCPALIVQGATDVIVPVSSAERLATAMRSNGNVDVTVRLFPDVSHALLPDLVGYEAEWPYLPAFETAPEILTTVSSWMAQRLK